MKKRTFTDEEIEKVIYNYTVLKMGQKSAGKEFHMNDRMVKRLLTENNIPIKSIQETNITEYNIDVDFFRYQSADLGYLLGLLSSDGCIASNENCVYIELQDSDSELLEDINYRIKNERPIKHYVTSRGYKNAKLYFFSKEIKDILGTYNIIPNKTYNPKFDFPHKLEKQYWIDYIRGYFDGDGCIKKTGVSLTFQLDSANKKIIETIQNFLRTEYNIETKITKTDKTNVQLWRLYCYGQEAQKIFDLMYYSNTQLRLKRKYEKYLLWKK